MSDKDNIRADAIGLAATLYEYAMKCPQNMQEIASCLSVCIALYRAEKEIDDQRDSDALLASIGFAFVKLLRTVDPMYALKLDIEDGEIMDELNQDFEEEGEKDGDN